MRDAKYGNYYNLARINISLAAAVSLTVLQYALKFQFRKRFFSPMLKIDAKNQIILKNHIVYTNFSCNLYPKIQILAVAN